MWIKIGFLPLLIIWPIQNFNKNQREPFLPAVLNAQSAVIHSGVVFVNIASYGGNLIKIFSQNYIFDTEIGEKPISAVTHFLMTFLLLNISALGIGDSR